MNFDFVNIQLIDHCNFYIHFDFYFGEGSFGCINCKFGYTGRYDTFGLVLECIDLELRKECSKT